MERFTFNFPLPRTATTMCMHDFYATGGTVLFDDESGLALAKENVVYTAGSPTLAKEQTDGRTVLALDDGFARQMLASGRANEEFRVYQLLYLRETPVPVHADGLTIRRLTMDDLDFVLHNYHHPGATVKHLTGRIEEYMLGAEVDGKLAGFIGVHEEGTMGLLEVLPEYRRRGIAEALEGTLVNDLLQMGRLPYCHVMTDNNASLHLQDKLGLMICGDALSWLFYNPDAGK